MSDIPEQDMPVIQSYVWHDGKCYFVSTIERNSSARLGPRRFNETIVWDYDWASALRGDMRHMDEAMVGSIFAHNKVCNAIHEKGIESLAEVEYR